MSNDKELSTEAAAIKGTAPGRVYAGVSREQRQRERRETLLTAAFEIIGSKGFKAATVRAVCAQAGLSNRYYYETFAGAEDMLIAVYQRQVQYLQGLLAETLTLKGASPEQLVEAAFTKVFTEFKNKPEMAKVLFIEVIGISTKVDTCHRHSSQQFVDLCLVFSRPFYAAVLPDHLNDEIIIRSLVGAVIQITTLWVLADFDYTVEEITTNMVFMAKAVIQSIGVDFHAG